MSNIMTMTQGCPMKLIFSFALPLMLGNIFQQLYTIVDTAIVGRGVGIDALAALGTVDWLSWMAVGIATGLTQGFSVKIAQKYGEGDRTGLKHFMGQSAVLAAGTVLILTLVLQISVPLLSEVMRIPMEIRALAELYIRILFGGLPCVMFYNYCSAALRAVGDGKTPLKAMMTASVTNIVLDIIAVFVLGWGIAGAAIATVFSQGLSGVICARRIWKTEELRFVKEDLQARKSSCLILTKLGAPIAAKNLLVSLGGIVIQTVVNGFGMSFIAGFTASNKLYGLLEIAALSYSFAVATYVGQNYGAGKSDRIRKGMKEATILALVTAVIIAGIMIVFGRPITMIFISADDPSVMAAAGEAAYLYLVFMSVSLPILYLLYVYQAAMQGMGKTMVPMVSGFLQLGIRVGLAIIVGIIGYETGVFIAEIAAWWGAGIFMLSAYYKNMRKK